MRQRYWIDKARLARRTTRDLSGHPLLGQKLELSGTENIHFESESDLLSVPWLTDYRVFDVAVLPAMGFLELALAAGAAIWDGPFSVSDVAFEQMLILPEEDATKVQLVLSPVDRGYRFQVFSLGADSQWIPHATGRLVTGQREKPDAVDSTRL